ncbi:MAG: hypothetical protein ACK5NK_12090 [Niabella sp.]
MKTKKTLKKRILDRLRFIRKGTRISLVIAGVLAAIILGFNYWFIHHSKSVIEEFVAVQSNGKMKLKVKGFTYNWLKNKIVLKNADLYTTDTAAPTTTRLSTSRIDVKTHGILPLLFKKQIVIDSIYMQAPGVIITKMKSKEESITKDTTDDNPDEKFSVAKELGKVANSINDAIEALQINSFVIKDGSFSLVDSTKKQEPPFVVTKINIQLDNLQVDEATGKKAAKKISFTDDIAIQTSDQAIVFPGGRHFMSFRNFKFALSDKRVEFDSCTIRGIKGDSSKTEFKIFFDKLQLTNINFDTLYAAEVVKADSVFCTNADIFFDIDADVVTAKKDKKRIQNIDELVQQLLGDVMLNYVIVKNADININTIRNGQVNTFSSANNYFELQGLMVRQNMKRPVNVKKMLLTLHNYETVLQDGRYAIAFDSIKFENDAITLNDFSFKEYSDKILINSLQMPGFEVRELSWESLLYNNVFNARSAFFYNPVISVNLTKRKGNRSKGVFQTLGDLGALLNLTNLGITNGNIKIDLGRGATLYLQQTDLSIYADELTASKKIKNIQHAINHLFVKKGLFQKGSTQATLTDISLTEDNNGIKASALLLKDEGLNAKALGIKLNSIVLDSINQTIAINGLKWDSAELNIKNVLQRANGNQAGLNNLALNNIAGGYTKFNMEQKGLHIAAMLNNIIVDEIYKPIKGLPNVRGLHVTGSNAIIQNPNLRIDIGALFLSHNQTSIFKNVSYSAINDVDSVLIKVPVIKVNPEQTVTLDDGIHINEMIIENPDILAIFGKKDDKFIRANQPESRFTFGTVLIQNPAIHLTVKKENKTPDYFSWNRNAANNSYLKIFDLKAGVGMPFSMKLAHFNLSDFEYKTNGKAIAVENKPLLVTLQNLYANRNASGDIEWKTNAGIIFKDSVRFDNIDNNGTILRLSKGAVNNIKLYSGFTNSLQAIIGNSSTLNFTGNSGSLTSRFYTTKWHNLSYQNNFFTVDSFSHIPHQTVKEYQIKKLFNEDYLSINGKAIKAGPFNMAQYAKDSILKFGSIVFNDIKLLSFKDKLQADTSWTEKPLPVTQIRELPGKINIDSVIVKNMYAEYREINPKTDTLAIVPVYDLNVVIKKIKNYGITKADTLYVDATANIINSLPIKLHLKESYYDSLGTFLMKLKTGSVNLDEFNNTLLPLEAVKFISGTLDSLNIESVANNNYAFGSANMYYKNLRVQLMNHKNFTNQNAATKILSWLANTFIIKKSNEGKPSVVYFERIKDKSSINFLIKTSLSGIKSGIGLPGKKKKERKRLHRQKE